jgi:hypothetical protein
MENKTTTQKLDLAFNRLEDNYGIIFNDFKEKVETAYPSIYTKADVILLMDDLLKSTKNLSSFTKDEVLENVSPLVDDSSGILNEDFYDELQDEITETLQSKQSDCFEINNEECEISIDYRNCIQVDQVDYEFDSDTMGTYIIRTIKKVVAEHLAKQLANITQTETEND